MRKLIVNEKNLRKRMIDMDIKTVNELSAKSGVSKPTIYDFLNGKSPLSAPFIRICEFLGVEAREVLIEESEEE